MSWCEEHDCPDSACDSYHIARDHRADANEDAAQTWKRRALDMKRRLDELAGGSAQWVDCK